MSVVDRAGIRHASRVCWPSLPMVGSRKSGPAANPLEDLAVTERIKTCSD